MSEVDEESKQVSYKVVRDENGNVKLDCPAIGKQFAPEEISAQVVTKILEIPAKPFFIYFYLLICPGQFHAYRLIPQVRCPN